MKRDLNFDLDFGKAREFVGKTVTSLRSNRLWPLALVLVVAIVAVPIALSKSSSGTPATAAPAATPPPGSAVAALNVQTTPGRSRLPGRGHDPFGGQGSGKTATSTSTTKTTTSSGTSTSGSSTTSQGGAGSAGSTSTPAPPTSSSTPPPSITPNKKPTPAPAGLAATQSYGVTLALTDPSGGLNTIDSLERLSVLPNASQPLLVELGVMKGGHRVLFLVQPGAVLNGPGTCTPGPVDCEILSLGQDQTEGLATQSSNGPTQVALFAVTGITAVNHPSEAAANAARRQESAAGRNLLNASTSQALSLFQYEPSLGVVVDESNLTARDP
jgi:hypothetical protein